MLCNQQLLIKYRVELKLITVKSREIRISVQGIPPYSGEFCGKSAAYSATAALLATVAAGKAAVVAVENATCLAVAGRAAVAAAGRAGPDACRLLSLLLEWQLLLAWLMLLQLLFLLLTELLSLLLGLQLLPVWVIVLLGLLLLSLLFFSPPSPPSCIFAVLAIERWWDGNYPALARAEDCCRRSRCARRLRAFQKPIWPSCLQRRTPGIVPGVARQPDQNREVAGR